MPRLHFHLQENARTSLYTTCVLVQLLIKINKIQLFYSYTTAHYLHYLQVDGQFITPVM